MALTYEQIASVQPSQVTDWLRGAGFERAAVSSRSARHFAFFRRCALNGTPALEIGVPLEPSFADYKRRLLEMLAVLADVMHRSPESLLREVVVADQDVVRLRAIGPSLAEGRVSVSAGARLVDSTRELLLAAACSAVHPKPAFQGRRYEEARGFLDRIKLAPPESGSFVIYAMTPVGRAACETDGTMGVAVPFARRATTMLGTALNRAAEAAQAAAIDSSYDGLLDSAEQGVSANLCAAIADFVDGEVVTELEASVRWAGSRPLPGIGVVQRTFTRESAEVLREAAARIRAVAPREDFTAIGSVIRLESHDAEEGGTAYLAAQVDGKPRSVRVVMGAEDYRLATRSHTERQTLLSCEGELVFRGRAAELDHVRDVEIVRIDPV